jgi:alanine dehydrogenase
MSEIAGRLAVQNGAYALQRPYGGRGILLSGVPCVERGLVVILGSGTVGSNAAKIAIGLGARVVVIDIDLQRLGMIEQTFDGRVETAISSRDTIEHYLTQADLVIGAVLVSGAKAPRLVTRAMLRKWT